MNCTTCRFELSQCLDGRLPSGRRSIVMQHVDACTNCALFWAELQAAQQLTLQLPKQGVSDGFREQLWERIRAGEGTPEATFHEPVPMLAKIRYLLTGAAAAAALLLVGSWLRNDGSPSSGHGDTRHGDTIAQLDTVGPEPARHVGVLKPENVLRPRHDARTANTDDMAIVGQPGQFQPRPIPPMLASAQPLTADLVAVEAARQFEQRYAAANRDLVRLDLVRLDQGRLDQGRLDQGQLDQGRADAGWVDGGADAGREQLVYGLLDVANELHTFAEVLLDLRDNDRLSFRDAEVGADLRLAANLLGQSLGQQRSLSTVRAFVVPALQQSGRLGQLARLIRVRPSFDQVEAHAEQEMLRRISTMRPELFSKLFVVIPNVDNRATFGRTPNGDLFLIEDQCGQSFVAPLSRVQEGNQRFQMWIDSGRTNQSQVHVEIHLNGQK